MKSADEIERLAKKIRIRTSDTSRERILSDAEAALVSSMKKGPEVSRQGLSIWSKFMKSKITKLAAPAAIVIAILIGMSYLGGSIGGSSVAFGDVLGYVQKHSYTCDLLVDTVTEKQGSAPFTMQAMVWELGRMRVDCSVGVGVGKISSITDFNASRTLLLFHQNKTGVIKKESLLNKNTGAGGIISYCTQPIENLWNVRDGTEEELGERQINGHQLTGFRVFREDPYFEYDITIWADSKSGVPSLVEAIAKPLAESYPSVKWTMKNFDLDVELDEGLFSLELPAGYSLAYQEDLDKFEAKTERSPEAEKIVQMLGLSAEGRKDEAVQTLLKINWTEPIEFGKKPYIFSISEKAYTSLNAEDQRQVNEDVSAMLANIRKIVQELLDLGQNAISVKQYEDAERYFGAGLQMGKLLDQNPNSMVIVHLVGIAVEKRVLKEMISLYTTTNNHEKLQEAEEQLRAAEAEVDKFRKEAAGQ